MNLSHFAVSSSLPSPAVTTGERSSNSASDATPQPLSVPPSNTQSNPPSLSGKLSYLEELMFSNLQGAPQ